ncbi:MAG: tyrosine-type recombinase/integrase [Candidatus Dormibacteria bacterium]
MRNADTSLLWVALRRDRRGELRPLASSGVQQIIKLAATAAGITKRVHPHLLRHSYATWAVQMNPQGSTRGCTASRALR